MKPPPKKYLESKHDISFILLAGIISPLFLNIMKSKFIFKSTEYYCDCESVSKKSSQQFFKLQYGVY